MASLDEDTDAETILSNLILSQNAFWNEVIPYERHEAAFKAFQLMPEQKEFLELEKKLEKPILSLSIAEVSVVCDRLLVLFKEMTKKAAIETFRGGRRLRDPS